ncbi:Fur family transcriptional regulator [Luteococcus sp. Sow4_B9]|uniref:Fur family transcriptional regulator n=1 Tax=Luteococcus sp. Sow4_B9 TaxID=3438792 RepID=UPI003F9DE3EE
MGSEQGSAELLRAAGMRVTAIRTAVLDVLAEVTHAEVDAVRTGVLQRVGSASVQSVYDALNALREAGVVRKVELAGHPALYQLHAHDNHHHMACRECGKIVDVPCAVGRMPCLTPVDTHGFMLDEAEVIYWGLCPDCRRD